MSQTDKNEQINKMSQTDSQDNKQVETMISMVKFEQQPVATWGCASKDFKEGEKKSNILATDTMDTYARSAETACATHLRGAGKV